MDTPPKIGLALGGGVVRGLAHIGVLEVLERHAIPLHCVTGASVGSLVGSAYCAGLSLAEIRAMALRLHWWDLGALTWPRRGLLSFRKLEALLIRTRGDLTFDQLHRPFAVAATDMETGAPVMLHTGRVAPAVHASCAVPGVIAPVEIDGRLLGDGNFSDSIPVRAARTLGANYVIGVDIMPPRLRRRLGPPGYLMAAIEILIQRAGDGLVEADCLIQPALSGATYLRFSKAHQLIALGAQAAEAQIPRIKQALGQ
jgi:NTE family protein